MNKFTHLHVHTQYSLLDGASKPAELIARAKELGMDSIAITDHGNMYGVISFYQEAKKQGIKPIIGCEIYVASESRFNRDNKEGMYHLILLAENEEGYHNLMKIVSLGYTEGFYYKPRVDKDLLRQYSKGLICLSACIAGEVPVAILQGDFPKAERLIEEYIDIFGKENYFFEIQHHDLDEEKIVREQLKKYSEKYGVRLVATNDLHYVKKEDAEAQDVLMCIQMAKTVDDPARMKFANDHFYLKSYEEMAERFPNDLAALEVTNEIAARCNVELSFGNLLLPEFPIPEGFNNNADEYLRFLCMESFKARYAKDLDAIEDAELRKAKEKELFERIDYELDIIKTMGYAAYFLIVWDFINFCRLPEIQIPVGPGRGSAAGSIVAYLLHITNVEPTKYDLLFERFLNPERVSMPDIDTDFCYKRRIEVIRYVIDKYGSDHVALIITFGTLQARAAVRDVGRALDIPLPKVDMIAKAVPRELGITLERALTMTKDLKEMYDNDPEVQRLIDIAKSVEGLPRNSGTHAAGVVIAPQDLKNYVPLQLAADEDEVIGRMITTQYDKDKVDEMGLLKMDFLGLRTLTVIGDTLKFIKENSGVEIDIDDIPLDDKATCEMLAKGDTQGVFQLESSGMTKLVVDLGPEDFKDLIPLVALYRPGPLGTGMADDFIQGRHGHKTAESMHPLLDEVLADTYGVVLYQEQVMKTTSVLAGFSLGEADILRRAMGKKKAKELDSMKEKFIEGAKKLHNIPEEQSEKIFGLLQHFAGYGFNKSHSVAYALVAYQTAYLKAHYPAEFFAAFLSSISGDVGKMSWYIAVCRERGIKVLAPDVNKSVADFSVEEGAIRFGFAGIKSVGDGTIESIVAARKKDGVFKSLLDFCKRVNKAGLNKRVIENLIKCGAFDSLGAKRSQLLAIHENVLDLGLRHQKDSNSGQMGLFADDSFEEVNTVELPVLDEMPKKLILQNEKDLIGFYVTGHPLDDYKKSITKYTPLYTFMEETPEVEDGEFVNVAGIISACKNMVTKKGDSMAVLTLEDFTGKIEVLVFPRTYTEYARYMSENQVISINGRFMINERERRINALKIEALVEDENLTPAELAALDALHGKPKGKPKTETYYQEVNTGDQKSKESQKAYSGKLLHLKILEAAETSEMQKQLAEVFKRYKGDTPIVMHLMATKKSIRVNDGFAVDAENPQLKLDLEKLLGENSVIVK